jgi:hypothetical protein
MPVSPQFYRLLSAIAAEGNRPRTPSEEAANEAFVLGVGSIKNMIEAKRQARQESGGVTVGTAKFL